MTIISAIFKKVKVPNYMCITKVKLRVHFKLFVLMHVGLGKCLVFCHKKPKAFS